MLPEDPEDLDTLIRRLNSGVEASREKVDSARQWEQWIERVIERNGSDLFLVVGCVPTMKVSGALCPASEQVLDAADIESAVFPLLPSHALEQYRRLGVADASFKVERRRFRINLHRERGRIAAAVRVLPGKVPTLSELNLPPETEHLLAVKAGLVIVGGSTGAGKTTTLAALVDAINARERLHVVTVEDPIEYEHTNKSSLIEQIEIYVDAPDFPTALRGAVRQAPDVLVVGEMRDPESMRIALSAAETGHLVLSSIHANDIGTVIGRVADSFPNERQNTIRQELSHALSAVMVQSLIPTADGGRAPVVELLHISYGARQHIRKNALQHLHQEIALTRKSGSLSFEESLARLVKANKISRLDGLQRARHPEEFELLVG